MCNLAGSLSFILVAVWSAASAAGKPAQCEKLLNREFTFQRTLTDIEAQTVTYPNGQMHPVWGKPVLGDARKTKEAISLMEREMKATPNANAVLLNLATPTIPHDADQVVFFPAAGGQQQLLLFGKSGCAVTIVVINLMGIFDLDPSRYFLVPGGGVVIAR